MNDELRMTIENSLVFTRDSLKEHAPAHIENGDAVIAAEVRRMNEALEWIKQQPNPMVAPEALRYILWRYGQDHTGEDHQRRAKEATEWLAALPTLPKAPRADWSQAPGDAEWWACNSAGDSWWSTEEPTLFGSIWQQNGTFSFCHIIEIPLGIDWRLLKEPRPAAELPLTGGEQ